MEFEIKGVKYRTAKLSVFEQLKVSRKLLPVLAGMVSDFRSVQEKISSKDTEGAMATILPKIANPVSDPVPLSFRCFTRAHERLGAGLPAWRNGV